MAQIKSESKFVWKFILDVLLTPFMLVLVLFRKKKFSEIFRPVNDLFKFITEAKATLYLICANVLIFVISLFFSAKTFELLISYPSDFFSPRFYTLITSGFLHAGIGHLLGNMLALFIFGRVVEKELGQKKMLMVYFGALIISGLFSSIINLLQGVNVGSLGASGAVMGLVSTAILVNPFYFTYELIIPLPIMVVGWLTIWADVTGIINPVADGIGHFAHLGGFVSIAIIMFFVETAQRNKLKKGMIINFISLILAAILYFAIA